MFRRLKPNRWLIVFVGVSDRDKRAVKRCVATVIEKLALNERTIGYEEISALTTREIGKPLSPEGEIQEMFAELVINPVYQWKRDGGWKNAAVVMPPASFLSEDIFKKIVNHYAFDDDSLYPICFKGDFLNISNRENCVTYSCKNCRIFDQCNEHSCLLRLIWLMFDSDDRVIDILKDMNGLQENP